MKKYLIAGIILFVLGGLSIGLLGIFCKPFRSFVKRIDNYLSASVSNKHDSLMAVIRPQNVLTQRDFTRFLERLNLGQKKLLMLSLSNDKEEKARIEAKTFFLPSHIEKTALETLSAHMEIPEAQNLNYHKMVQQVAKLLDVDQAELRYASTFQLERRITEKVFVKIWDKLAPRQREKVLKDVYLGIQSSYFSKIEKMIDKPEDLESLDLPAFKEMLKNMLLESIFLEIEKITEKPGDLALEDLLAFKPFSTGIAFYQALVNLLAPLITSSTEASVRTIVESTTFYCPVGLIIGGTFLAGDLFMENADQQRVAAFIIQAHFLKVETMYNLGIDPQQYIIPIEQLAPHLITPTIEREERKERFGF